MIVVNGVMGGFSHEMRDRLHGVMSDVTIESRSASGFPNAWAHMERIRKICGDKIESMTPLCQSQGLVSYQLPNGQWLHLPVVVIGVDSNEDNVTKEFGQYFQHPLNRKKLSFQLREDGYEQSADPDKPRQDLKNAGWKYRRKLPPPQPLAESPQPIDVKREPVSNPSAELERINNQVQTPPQTSNQPDAPPPVPDMPQQNYPLPDTQAPNSLLPETPPSIEGSEADNGVPSPMPNGADVDAQSDNLNAVQPFDASQSPEISDLPDSISPKEQTPVPSVEQQDEELKTFSNPHDTNEPPATKNISGKNAVKVQVNYPSASPAEKGDPSVGTIDMPELSSDPHAEREALEQEQTQEPKDESEEVHGDPFSGLSQEEIRTFDPRKEQHTGLIMGIALASRRSEDGEEKFYCRPGDDVKLTMASAEMPPKGITDNFTVVDIYESKMSEFDAMFVFIPLAKMQDLRAMKDPRSGIRSVNSIRIKLKDERDCTEVRNMLQKEFDISWYIVQTWQDQRHNLLAAVEMERSVMNVLLFLIIAVCGFSIMTIFLMIVSEKVKDIGILRALGASSPGIMIVFLSYGLLLGVVGSVFGVIGGLIFLDNINLVADGLSYLTGRPVFSPEIYYFYKIPTYVEWQTVTWIVVGTIIVTVLASVFPAWRAASMQPVETLRS